MTSRSLPCLIADIGGTHARFAVVRDGGVSDIRAFNDRDFASFPLVLDHYWRSIGKPKLEAVALAVAGAVIGDCVRLTNFDWVCDRMEIKELLSVDRVYILNDFEALAYAIGRMQLHDLDVIQIAKGLETHPKLILGPGTGLGVAALKPLSKGGSDVITTEAGHVRYAVANDHESAIVKFLGSQTGFVSVENLVSGPGLVNLYRAECHIRGLNYVEASPAHIVAQASNGDAICLSVIDVFSTMLGGFASQMTLSTFALGGVYLTGGVLDKLGALFNRKLFLERFLANPKMGGLLRQVPVFHVMKEIPAFDGLLAVLEA